MLSISIGIDIVALAAEGSQLWPHLKVLDVDAFARDVVSALESEAEDGTTDVHRLLDKATQDVYDDGAESVEWDDDAHEKNADPPGDRRRAWGLE